MAKKVYGYDAKTQAMGEGIHIVQKPTKAKHKGYDYIDPQGRRIAGAVGVGVAKGAIKVVGHILKHAK